jgi:hypothetical protein
MTLIPPEILALLQSNNLRRDEDHVPVLKLFAPWGAATWLITEIEPDGDTLFGLCDLGMGEPELGYLSLEEITSATGPLGLKIEIDLYWSTDAPLSAWAAAARSHRRIPSYLDC